MSSETAGTEARPVGAKREHKLISVHGQSGIQDEFPTTSKRPPVSSSRRHQSALSTYCLNPYLVGGRCSWRIPRIYLASEKWNHWKTSRSGFLDFRLDLKDYLSTPIVRARQARKRWRDIFSDLSFLLSSRCWLLAGHSIATLQLIGYNKTRSQHRTTLDDTCLIPAAISKLEDLLSDPSRRRPF